MKKRERKISKPHPYDKKIAASVKGTSEKVQRHFQLSKTNTKTKTKIKTKECSDLFQSTKDVVQVEYLYCMSFIIFIIDLLFTRMISSCCKEG